MTASILAPDASGDAAGPDAETPLGLRSTPTLPGYSEPVRTLGERFRNGEETALTELYHHYSGAMFSTALSLLNDRELAADAVQQAFVQAWRSAGSFDPRRPLEPWLYVIVRRTAIDAYRRERHRSGYLSLDEGTVDLDILATSQLEDSWCVWQVREALDRLSADERQVIQLAYYAGYTQREISKRLGIAVGTVNGRIARAHGRLTDLLSHMRHTL
ncbi:RNA polymerase sigma factor [Streptomyces sp. NPDC099088]|uniref:RNA polymerase sigma factor n=1 Tax=Streptomyces sp. NPDC099088 TaxID=3366101 RepID=UPI003813C72C